MSYTFSVGHHILYLILQKQYTYLDCSVYHLLYPIYNLQSYIFIDNMNNLYKNNTKNNYTPVPFAIAILIFSCAVDRLFFNQASQSIYMDIHTQLFCSDLPLHIDLAFKADNPSIAIFDVLIVGLHNLTGISPVYLSKSLLTFFTVVSSLIIRSYFRKCNVSYTASQQYRIDFFSVSLLLVGAILIPGIPIIGISPNWYLFKFPPNAWHNCTYISCRFFAIIVFFLVFKSYETFIINKSKSVVYYTLLAVFSILCMLSKPSFFIGFMPACCLVMAIELFVTKFKSFWPSFWCGVSFIPSLIILLWQNNHYFGAESDAKIALMPFQVFIANGVNIPHLFLNTMCGIIFPLYIIYLCFKKRYFTFFSKISIANFFISFAVAMFLAESGNRFYDANMTWTALSGNFFAFMLGAKLLIDENLSKKENITAWILYLIHLLFGISYFIWLSVGRHYV